MSTRKTTAFIPATILLAFLGTGFGVVCSHPDMMTSLLSRGAPNYGTDVSEVSLYLKDNQSISINNTELKNVTLCLDATGTNFDHEGVLSLHFSGVLNEYIYPSRSDDKKLDNQEGVFSTTFSLKDSTISDSKAYREFDISFAWYDGMEPVDHDSFRSFAKAVNGSSSQFLFEVKFF